MNDQALQDFVDWNCYGRRQPNELGLQIYSWLSVRPRNLKRAVKT
jgi:hypothetical protein